MVVALPGLLVLAGLLVAWGLIFMGRAFVDALFSILKYVLRYSGAGLVFRAGGWLLSKVGVQTVDPLTVAHQWLTNKLGAAAEGIGDAIAVSWHALEAIVKDTGFVISRLGVAVDRLRAFLSDMEHFAKLIVGTSAFALAVKALRSNVTKVMHDTTTIVKQIAAPITSPVGAAIKVVTRIDRTAVTNLRAWTTRKIHALEAAIAHAGAQALPLPGNAVGDIRKALERALKRVAKLERGATGYIAAGALTFALARLGLGWLRCDRVRKVGKGLCGLDAGVMDELLAGSLLVLTPLSIIELAHELAAVTEDMADAVLWIAGGVDG